jgi:hypothetical protein
MNEIERAIQDVLTANGLPIAASFYLSGSIYDKISKLSPIDFRLQWRFFIEDLKKREIHGEEYRNLVKQWTKFKDSQ